MDLWTALSTMLRRWYIVLPVLMLTFVTMAGFALRFEPTYQASGVVLFVSPSTVTSGTEEVVVNPLLNFTASLNTTRSSIARIVDGGSYRERIAQEGLSTDYEFAGEVDGPLLTVAARADTADGALGLLNRVISGLDDELSRLQSASNTPEDQWIRIEPLTADPAAIPLSGARNRTLLGTFVLGVAAAVGAALLTDGVSALLARRREQALLGTPVRSAVPAPDADADPAPSIPDPAAAGGEVPPGVHQPYRPFGGEARRLPEPRGEAARR